MSNWLHRIPGVFISIFLFFIFLGLFFFVVKETVTVSMSYILRGSCGWWHITP